jgi:hypothetical protein
MEMFEFSCWGPGMGLIRISRDKLRLWVAGSAMAGMGKKKQTTAITPGLEIESFYCIYTFSRGVPKGSTYQSRCPARAKLHGNPMAS